QIVIVAAVVRGRQSDIAPYGVDHVAADGDGTEGGDRNQTRAGRGALYADDSVERGDRQRAGILNSDVAGGGIHRGQIRNGRVEIVGNCTDASGGHENQIIDRNVALIGECIVADRAGRLQQKLRVAAVGAAEPQFIGRRDEIEFSISQAERGAAGSAEINRAVAARSQVDKSAARV